MDYNKDDKGFVCFMYRLIQKRILYIVFGFVMATLGGILNFEFFKEDEGFSYIVTAFVIIFSISMVVAINPRAFALKLIGFFTYLACIMIILHNLSKFSDEIFSLYFTIMSVVGFLVVATLLSWFVYNARSSEISNL